MVNLYEQMFKRKSFRQFKCCSELTEQDLDGIAHYLETLAEPLGDRTSLAYKIVPRHETSCKRGEYCILIYSQQDNLSLLNLGFVFGQLDFYLSSMNIGSCWYGMGKPHELYGLDNLPYAIMIAIGKVEEGAFRKNYTLAKRKSNEELFFGDGSLPLLDYVKYTPSACNSQPWLFSTEGNGLNITMNAKTKMLIPKDKISFYNTIDLGLMMFSCEIWFKKHGIEYSRSVTEQNEPLQTGQLAVRYHFSQVLKPQYNTNTQKK